MNAKSAIWPAPPAGTASRESAIEHFVTNCGSPTSRRHRRAFTLIELLVVIAIIAILAGMLFPALSRGKSNGQSAVCQGNLRQLMLGWMLYADDNDYYLAGSISVGRVNQPGSWVLGNTKQDRTTSNIVAGVMFPYASAAGAYRCPADRSTVDGQSGLPRTRSYTENGWMNSSMDDKGPNGNQYSFTLTAFQATRHKLSQIVRPPPSGTFVFIDEHEKSIDDGLWNNEPNALVEAGVPVLRPEVPLPQWYNLPAVRHNQGANLAFADGHADFHKWLWPQRKWTPSTPRAPQNVWDKQDLVWTLTLSPNEW